MSNQTNRILDEISEDEKFIKVHSSYTESCKKNIRRSEEFYQRDIGENKDLTIQ